MMQGTESDDNRWDDRCGLSITCHGERPDAGIHLNFVLLLQPLTVQQSDARLQELDHDGVMSLTERKTFSLTHSIHDAKNDITKHKQLHDGCDSSEHVLSPIQKPTQDKKMCKLVLEQFLFWLQNKTKRFKQFWRTLMIEQQWVNRNKLLVFK